MIVAPSAIASEALAAQALERAAQSGLAVGGAVQGRERDRAQARLVEPFDLFQLDVGEHRAPQLELAAMRRRFLEQVLLGSDRGDRGRHHLFANRIDRRIGDLGEKLLEVVEQQLRDLSDSTASGVSVPIEPTGSCPLTAIGARIIFSSSIV